MVLAILSVCVALVAPGLSPERFTDSMKTGIRRFSAFLAQARNRAMLTGNRQVIRLKPSGSGSGERACYFLLSASRDQGRDGRSSRDGESSAEGCFPFGVRVEGIFTGNNTRKEEGARFLLLPSGLIQPGLIHLQEEERKRSLRLRPFRPYPEVLQGHPRAEASQGAKDAGTEMP